MYTALSFYRFVQIEDPQLEVKRHKAFFEGRDITCRIYLSSEGINGQMSASVADGEAYVEWLRGDPRFADLDSKPEPVGEQLFPRVTVKVRPQLVALGHDLSLGERGSYLKPAEWRALLESDEDLLILDGRNDYEWDLGHFEGAERPPCRTFRDFPAYARQLKQQHGTDKKVLMSCTGGIRCELFSSLLRQEGFERVYQLEGGVIKYGQEEQGAHWRGRLFVFDDRLGVPVGEADGAITPCHACETLANHYYNCANMDCNRLFLSCPECLELLSGCCSEECKCSERVRPVDEQTRGKPFRRLSSTGAGVPT